MAVVGSNKSDSHLDSNSDGYEGWLAEGRRLLADLPKESWDDNWFNDDYKPEAEGNVRVFFWDLYFLFMNETSKITTRSGSQPDLSATLGAPGSSCTARNPLPESTTSQVSQKSRISPKRARAAATRLAREILVLDTLRRRLQRKYQKMNRLSVP
jgi:hypothetical protein